MEATSHREFNLSKLDINLHSSRSRVVTNLSLQSSSHSGLATPHSLSSSNHNGLATNLNSNPSRLATNLSPSSISNKPLLLSSLKRLALAV